MVTAHWSRGPSPQRSPSQVVDDFLYCGALARGVTLESKISSKSYFNPFPPSLLLFFFSKLFYLIFFLFGKFAPSKRFAGIRIANRSALFLCRGPVGDTNVHYAPLTLLTTPTGSPLSVSLSSFAPEVRDPPNPAP